MSWVRAFYQRQSDWSGLYRGDPARYHAQKSSLVQRMAGPPPRTVLELGAGGGLHAAATADAGYTITAVELVEGAAQNIIRLAEVRSSLSAVQGDFYTVQLAERFEVVCYWDGFGVGEDADQRRLLRRIAAEWLVEDGGCALMDVYTPWSASASVGFTSPAGKAQRVYGFDVEGCRWLDRWTLKGESVEQSLRCYSPADLRLLLEGTGLHLDAIEVGGGMDWTNGRWSDSVPLEKAMIYTARLLRG